jgi:integration host factor subunit beta
MFLVGNHWDLLVDNEGLLVTKKDIVKTIAENMGLNQEHAREVVQGVLDGIIKTLLNEGRIELRNFGVFEIKKRRPRKARNPRTGEAIDVPAKIVVTFKAGREMEERVGKSREVPGGGTVAAAPS